MVNSIICLKEDKRQRNQVRVYTVTKSWVFPGLLNKSVRKFQKQSLGYVQYKPSR